MHQQKRNVSQGSVSCTKTYVRAVSNLGLADFQPVKPYTQNSAIHPLSNDKGQTVNEKSMSEKFIRQETKDAISDPIDPI